MLRKNEQIVPVLRVNNRNINQAFLEKTLGMKTKLEEGPFAEFGGGLDFTTKLVLMESPGARTRAVQGKKKLDKIVIKAAVATEIEHLLVCGASYSKLYKGKNGYGFEAVSPEGDRFLVHAEASSQDLTAILPPVPFEAQEGVEGLSDFQIESIWINTPQPSVSQDFYEAVLAEQDVLQFVGAEGADLLTPTDQVWDLDSLRIPVDQDFAWADLEGQLEGPFFKDKKETFLQTVDPSGIELWFEK